MLAEKLTKITSFNVLITFFFDDDDDIDIVFETFVNNFVLSLILYR